MAPTVPLLVMPIRQALNTREMGTVRRILHAGSHVDDVDEVLEESVPNP